MEKQQHELQGVFIKVEDKFYNVNTLSQQTYEQILRYFAGMIDSYNKQIEANNPNQEEVKDGE